MLVLSRFFFAVVREGGAGGGAGHLKGNEK